MIKFLVYLCIILLFIAFIVIIYDFYKTYGKKQSLNDTNISYLNTDIKKIKCTSKKFGNRIRGSVRMSQGRIRDIDEMYLKEQNINFLKI